MTLRSTAKMPNPTAHDSGGGTQPTPPPIDDVGFITPRGRTTPLRSAVPLPLAVLAVTTANSFGKFESDDDVGSVAAPTPPTSMVPYDAIKRAVNESIESILANIHRGEAEHQARPAQNFGIHSMSETMQRRDFEAKHSSFFNGIETKLRGFKLGLDVTTSALGSALSKINARFSDIAATLTSVADKMTVLSGLLVENRAQLHQLRDNKASRVTAMQEQRDRLDNIDATLLRITSNVNTTALLTKELDSRVSGLRPVAEDDHPRPGDQPLARGFVVPVDSDGTLQSTAAPAPVPDDNATTPAPNDVPNIGGLPADHSPAPHRFANVNLGATGFASQQASSYPSGNRSAHFDRPPPAGPPQV
jgi:hypothetical protein